MMARRRLGALLATVTALAVAACDSGPEGPGVLVAKVTSTQPLGAVVLEFNGGGITGFEPRGATQVFGAATSAGIVRQRVILVSPTGSTEIPFGIAFQDRAAPMPSVVAVSAVLPSNVSVSAAGLKVRIER